MATLLLCGIVSFFPAQADCLTLAELSGKLRHLILEDLPIYRMTEERKLAGKIVKIDWNAKPPVVQLNPETALVHLQQLCVLRRDLESHIAYEVAVVRHDNDGLACISFDEGMVHGKIFQRIEHNRAREVSIKAYYRSAGQWILLSPQSGFSKEAFLFDCGIRVGDAELLDLIEKKELQSGHLLISTASRIGESLAFESDGEIALAGTKYLRGRGKR